MQRKPGLQAESNKLINWIFFINRQKVIAWHIIGQVLRQVIKPALKKIRKNTRRVSIGMQYASVAPAIMTTQKLLSIFSWNVRAKTVLFMTKQKRNLSEFNSSKASRQGLIQSSIAFIR